MNNLQCVPYVDIDFCINNLIFSSSSAVSGHKCKWSHNVITTKNLTRKSRRQKHDWVRTKWSEAPQSTASSRGVTVERSPFISSCLSAQKEISWEEKTYLLQKPEREQCDMSDPGSERCSGARRAAGSSRIRSDQTDRSEVPPHVFPLLQKSGDMLSITDRYQHFTYR